MSYNGVHDVAARPVWYVVLVQYMRRPIYGTGRSATHGRLGATRRRPGGVAQARPRDVSMAQRLRGRPQRQADYGLDTAGIGTGSLYTETT